MTTRTAPPAPSTQRPLPPAPPITRPSHRNLQPELAEFADNRRFAGPVTPYRRGFEDCIYDRVFANPYPPHSAESVEYNRGHGDARVSVLERRPVLFDAETEELDRLLRQRGRMMVIERTDLRTGDAVHFAIGADNTAGERHD